MVLDFKLMERFLMLENNNNGSNNNDNNSNNNVAGMNALDFSANAPWGGKKKDVQEHPGTNSEVGGRKTKKTKIPCGTFSSICPSPTINFGGGGLSVSTKNTICTSTLYTCFFHYR